MKRFAFACVLCGGLLVVVGCKETTSQPAAQSPATESADQVQVMKPALPAETEPETKPAATSGEEPEPKPEPASGEKPEVESSADDSKPETEKP